MVKDKYDTREYAARIKKNYKSIFINAELFSFLLIIVALNFNVKILGICTIIVYMLLFLYKLKTNNKTLKIDKRIRIRIIGILFIYLTINIWFYMDYNSYHSAAIIFDNTPFYYIILITITYLSYFIVYLVNIISKPIDKLLK